MPKNKLDEVPNPEEFFNKNKAVDVDSFVTNVWYLFWDKGISLKEFNQLPLYYILAILKKQKEYNKKIKKQKEKKEKRY